jgi:hypothetical protein
LVVGNDVDDEVKDFVVVFGDVGQKWQEVFVL